MVNKEDNKAVREFNRLLEKHGWVMAKLNIIDADIVVQRNLELLNDIPFLIRPSIDMERQRENWQQELEATRASIGAVIEVIEKQSDDPEVKERLNELINGGSRG